MVLQLRPLFSDNQEWSQSEGFMGIKWNRVDFTRASKRESVSGFPTSVPRHVGRGCSQWAYCPVHCKALCGIPGRYTLDARCMDKTVLG